ncbi:FecR domain-containing protein [bacterium]|nr:FecR domain-containing protein [bacterium]
MSRKVLLFLLIAALAALAGAKVTYAVGSVTFYRGGIAYTASLHTKLSNGDIVRTGDRSKVELTFSDGSIVRLSSNSELTVNRAESSGLGTSTVLTCAGGRLWSNVIPFKEGGDSSYVVKTPTSTAAVRGTIFRTNVGADTSTSVRVYDGQVEVSRSSLPAAGGFGDAIPADWGSSDRHEIEGPIEVEGPTEVSEDEWAQIIGNMQEVIIGADGSTWVGSFTNDDDSSEWEWVLWNQSRDTELGMDAEH